MISKTKIDDALDAAFRAALVLTGSGVAAERSVLEALACVEPDLAGEGLLIETAKAAIRQRRKFLNAPDTSATLPMELRALSLLSPVCRDCFVLRILAGLGAEVCSGILGLSKSAVEDALHESLLDLPHAIDSFKSSIAVDSGSG